MKKVIFSLAVLVGCSSTLTTKAQVSVSVKVGSPTFRCKACPRRCSSSPNNSRSAVISCVYGVCTVSQDGYISWLPALRGNLPA